MALTDATVKSAKLPVDKKQLKLFDGGGLYLLVLKSGKYWRLDYHINSKRKTLAMGAYPEVPLAGNMNVSGVYQKGARDLCNEAKRLIKQGIDPSQKKQQDKHNHLAEQAHQKAFKPLKPTHLKLSPESGIACMQPAGQPNMPKPSCGVLSCMCFPSLATFPLLLSKKPIRLTF